MSTNLRHFCLSGVTESYEIQIFTCAICKVWPSHADVLKYNLHFKVFTAFYKQCLSLFLSVTLRSNGRSFLRFGGTCDLHRQHITDKLGGKSEVVPVLN